MKSSSRITKSLLWLFMLLSLLLPAVVQAATITVTNNSDSEEAGSLRQAIADAVAGDTITFAGDYTIPLNGGLTIERNLTINGGTRSVTIDGQDFARAFTVNTGVTFNLNAITVTNGKADDYGGGIFNYGTVTVTNSAFSNNSAGYAGGGIANYGGALTVTNSTFSGNSASHYGGGIWNEEGTLTVTNSTFSGNSAPDGGGIYRNSGTATLKNTILANSTGGNCSGTITDGGGNLRWPTSDSSCVGAQANPLLGTLGNYGGPTQTFPLLPGSPAINAGVSATCSASPVSSKDQRGVTRPSACDMGAFESQGFTLGSLTGTPQGTNFNTAFATPLGLTVTSAFSEPVAGGQVTFTPPTTGASAAIATSPAMIGSDSKVSVTATANGTVGSYNVVASAVGAAASVNFALTNGIQTTTTLASSLNPATFGQSVTFTATVAPAPTGGTVTFKDGGADIAGCVGVSLSSGQATCATAALSLGTHTITDVYSGDTTYNSSTSSALTQTVNSCGDAITVNNNTDNGPGSLRQAIAGSCAGGTITFNNDYTITLGSTLTIDKNLTIDGETHNITVSGNNAVRVFSVDAGVKFTLTLTHITVTNGKTNSSDGGGGILAWNRSTLNITNCIFSDNQAANSVGGGAITVLGKMTVTNSTFSGNSSNSGGGAIYASYNFTRSINNCTFIGNRATSGEGGAIYNAQGMLNVTNSTFSGNSAAAGGGGHDGSGGGIFNYDASGQVNVTNSTFFGNSAGYGGGSGIYSQYPANATLKNVIIDNSTGSGSNCNGSFTDNGGNLENGNDCGFGASRSNKITLLGPLGYYPGTAATQTFSLLPGSPAIDAGVSGCDATDQRGAARVGACDSGAFESQGFTLGSLTGTPQSAIIPNAFGAPLGLTVTSAAGEPVANGKVTFTPPASGASATIVTSPATIGSDGKVSVTATTNSQIGRYSVVASATGAIGQIFDLINRVVTTTTRLSSSTNPSVLGQSVTFTATVSTPGSNTPMVTFKDGTSIICDSVEVKFHDSGDGVATATCTTSALAQGDHTITTVYSDLNDPPGGSDPATLTQTVNSCTPAITVTNNTDNDSGSLRQAIAGLCPGGTINFDGDYTILLSSELAIAKNLTIDGTGHKVTVSGNHTTRVFNVTTGMAVAFKRLTIADGDTQTTDCGNATDGSASTSLCGGGLILQNSSVGVTVTDSTFSGNKAAFGGSIFNGGTLTVTNSTFSGNSADYGGGVINAGTLTMTNSTLSGNAATANGGGINNLGTLNLYNSILANSTHGSDCWKSAGTVTGTNNIIETDSPTKACGTTSPINSDPILADALADNGGDTQTFALLSGSPAIEAGTATGAPATDQRGAARPQGNGYDIGAYEFPLPTVSGILPTNGTTFGGTSITITGINFTDATSVTIGGTAATGVSVVSATSIAAITPAGAAGAKDVVVTSPDGSGTGTGLFTYIPTYTVTYNANGSTTGTAPDAQTKTQGINLTLATNSGSLTKTGSTFAGWNTAANGLSTDYAVGATYSTNAAITLYAKWTALPTYTVTFNNNGGSGTMAAQTASVVTALTTNTFTRVGYSFLGWNSNADGTSGTSYADGASYPFTANITLYARWSVKILYVDVTATGLNDGSSWANAYTDLQSTLTAAVSGNKIYVAQGTYKPAATDRTATFQLKNGVTLQGGYQTGGTGLRDTKSYITTLSGDLLGNDNSNIAYDEATRSENSLHVVTGSGTDNTAILDGFTISGGNANDYYALGASGSYGAGIYTDAGSPTLQNVTSSNNSAMNYGAGIYNTNGSSASITDVAFTSNHADSGGGMYNNASSPTVRNAIFNNNSISNNGGGMYNAAGSSPLLTNVTFSGNAAGYGGAIFNNGSSSNPALMNVTFSGNSANFGGAIYNFNNSAPVLTNCILWGDFPDEINYNDTNATVVTYSVVQGGYSGTGNLSTDPNFGPPGNYGGYTQTLPLLPGSPAINTGTSTGAPSTDQRGIARPQGAGYDIGAFEADTTTAPQPTVTSITANSAYPVAPVNVTINGTNFTGTPIVLLQKSGFANIVATNALVNSGQITCTLDITGVTAGTWNVVVLNQDGHSGALTNGFTVQDITHGNLYVDKNSTGGTHDGTGWASAFTDLVGILAASRSGDTIHVAQGTYKPTTGADRTKTFQLKTGVSLFGGYPTGGPDGARDSAVYTTTLSGDIGIVGNNSDNSYNVVTGSGTDSTAIIDGFTVTGGNADGSKGYYSGGGMYNNNGSPTVRMVTFSGNSAQSGGGIYNGDGSPALTNVTFSHNSADTGGGMYNSSGTQTLTNVTFSNNSAGSGGGMNSSGGTQTLTNVTFSNNSAGGSGGGIYKERETQTLTNVTFSGNSSSSYGGGLYTGDDKSSYSTLTNVTFSGNSASSDGGGIFNGKEGSLTATNCILWGNTPNEIVNGGSATVTYSVVKDGFAGAGNLGADPKLGTLGNYGGYTQTIPLLTGSSAIDAGSATGAPSTDQRGTARPQGSGYDIGAYEVATHTVTFNNNNGSGTMTAQTANVATALTTHTFTRTGYIFASWNTAAGGSGTSYADGASYPFTADTTLYAQWTALPTHTVTYNANGGIGTMTGASSPYLAGATVTVLANTFTRTGYTFAGWYPAADGSGTAYGVCFIMGSANTTLYAKWTVSASGAPTYSWSATGGTTVGVYRTDPEGTVLFLGSYPAYQTSYVDTSTLPNTIYTYCVKADNNDPCLQPHTIRTPLYNGWNIVGVPYNTTGVAVATLFSNPVSSVYEWVPTGSSNPDYNGHYLIVSSLTPGKGYFVNAFNSNTMLAYSGAANPSAVTMTLKPGYTLITNTRTTTMTDVGTTWLIDGTPLTDAITSTPPKIGGAVYWWDGIAYDTWTILTDNPTIEPWKAYWILNMDTVNHTLTIQ